MPNTRTMKKLWKETLILCCILAGFVTSNELSAQKWIKEGYLIDNDSDTLQGWIDMRKSLKNVEFVWFSTSSDGNFTPVEASTLQGYTLLDGLHMISRQVSINGVTRVRFIEYLVDGIVDLYLVNEDGQYYYLIEIEGKEPLLLDDTNKSLERDDETYIVKSHQYIGALKAAMADCPDLFPQIETMTLSSVNLVKLSHDYHDRMCSPGAPCLVYQRESVSRMSVVSPDAGLVFGAIKMTNLRTGDAMKMTAGPALLGGINISVPAYRGYYELDVEYNLNFTRRRFYGEYMIYDELNTQIRKFEYSAISMFNAAGVRYKSQQDRVIFSGYIGFVMSGNLSTELESVYDYYEGSQLMYTSPLLQSYYPTRLLGFRGDFSVYFPLLYNDYIRVSIGYHDLLASKRMYVTNNINDEYRISESAIYIKLAYNF